MNRTSRFPVFALPVLACSLMGQDAVINAVREGNSLYLSEKYKEALEAHERALALRPGMPEALVGKGRAQIKLGQGLAALDSCNEAVNQQQSVETFSCRASAYANLNGDIAALGDWQAALRLDANVKDVYRERAAFLHKLGRKVEAVDDLQRYITFEKRNAGARWTLADWLRELGKEREAIAQLDELLRIEPGRKDAYQMRADAHIALGEMAAAIEDFTKTLGESAADAAGYARRAQLYAAVGNMAGAWRDTSKAASLSVSAEEKAKWGAESQQYLMSYLTAERDDAQRLLLMEGLEAETAPTNALLELKYLSSRRAGQDEKAMRVVEELAARSNGTFDMYLFAADRAAKLKSDPRKLITWCRKALALSTEKDQDARRDLNYLQGSAYMQLQQFSEANVVLRAAAAYAGPAGWRANLMLLLGYANYQMRQAQEAVRFYSEALSIAGPHQQQVAKNIAAVKAEFQIP